MQFTQATGRYPLPSFTLSLETWSPEPQIVKLSCKRHVPWTRLGQRYGGDPRSISLTVIWGIGLCRERSSRARRCDGALALDVLLTSGI